MRLTRKQLANQHHSRKPVSLRSLFFFIAILLAFPSFIPAAAADPTALSDETLLLGSTMHEQNTNSGLINLGNNGHAALVLHQVGGDYANEYLAVMQGLVEVYDSSNQLIRTASLMDVDEDNFVDSASIAQLKNGGFVVAWSTGNKNWDYSTTNAYYQIYDNIGNPVGSAQQISNRHSNMTGGISPGIKVIGRSNGGFAVVFTDSISLDVLAAYSCNAGIFSLQNESVIGENTSHIIHTPTETLGVNLFISTSEPKIVELSDGSLIVEDFCYIHESSTSTPLGFFVFKFDSSGLPMNFTSGSSNGYPMMRINWMQGGDIVKGSELVALSDGGFATITTSQNPTARWEVAIYENDGTPRITDTLTTPVYYGGSFVTRSYYGKAIANLNLNESISASRAINAMELNGQLSVILTNADHTFTEWKLSSQDASVISSQDIGLSLEDSDSSLIDLYRIKLPNGELAYTYESFIYGNDGYITSGVYSVHIAYSESITFNMESGVTGYGTNSVTQNLLGETLQASSASGVLTDGVSQHEIGVDNYSLYASSGETNVAFSVQGNKQFDLSTIWLKDGGNASGQGETIRITSSKGTVEKTYVYDSNVANSGLILFDAATDDPNHYLQGITSFDISVADGSINGLAFDEIELDNISDNTDTTAPAISSGTITASNAAASSVDLNWTAATDAVTAAADLHYKVVYSTSNNVDTVTNAETNGTVAQDWSANLTSKTVNGLIADTMYYFNVLVKDAAGNKSAYSGTSETTANNAAKNVHVYRSGSLIDDYETIQEAVSHTVDGDTVLIDAGIYREQVTITTAITLQGAGVDSTIIESPDNADLAISGSNWKNLKNQDVYGLIGVKTTGSGTVTIKALTVDGRDQGYFPDSKYADKMAYTFVGIGAFDSNMTVDAVKVTGVRELATDYGKYIPTGYLPQDQPAGANHNDSIFAESRAGAGEHTLTLTNSMVTKFQKDAILAWGPTLTVDIRNNTIQGYGQTLYSTGNGMQIASSDRTGAGGANGDRRGTKGQILNNTITGIGLVIPPEGTDGHYYDTGLLDVSALLVYQGGSGIEIAGNTITRTFVPSWHSNVTSGDWEGYGSTGIGIVDTSSATVHDNAISGYDNAIDGEIFSATSPNVIAYDNTFNRNVIDYWTYNGHDQITLADGAEIIGYSQGTTGIDTITNFGSGDKIRLIGMATGSVHGMLDNDPIIDFTDGTVTSGDGTSVAAHSVQLEVSGGNTILYADTDGASGAAEFQIKLVGIYAPAHFALAGSYISYVPDTTAPVITLTGNATENVANGASYSDAGAAAIDDVDGDLTGSIVVTITNDVNAGTTFDSTVAGTYTYHYNVSDAAGNDATEVTRTVVVAPAPDTTAPTVGNDGTVSASHATTGSVDLSWTAATDNVTSAADLQYKVVYSTSHNIHTVSNAETNGTVAQDWSANLTSRTVSGLSSHTTYYFNVLVKDAAGNKSVYSGTSEATAVVHTSTTPSQPDASSNTSDVEVLVNGKVENAGTAKTTTRDDKMVTTITVDQQKLDNKLAAEGQGAVVTIPVKSTPDIVVGVLNGQMIKNMEDKQAVLVLQTQDASYRLPANQINIGSIASQLGAEASLQTIQLQVEIAAPDSHTVTVVENAAKSGTFSLVVPPLDFSVKAMYGDKSVEVAKFNIYVERTIALPEGVDPSKITTGVVVEPDGTVRHVPTRVEQRDGKYYAVINSLTNSTYSVVWHPLTFSDVSNHWAKQAVNDMGSRMVINGTGEDQFSPSDNITRAEFAAILVRGLGLRLENGASGFVDVKESDWYNAAIKTAAAYQLIQGFEDGTFRPNDTIAREQAMAMTARAMKITGLTDQLADQNAASVLHGYIDAEAVSDWSVSSVAECVQASVVTGKPGQLLAPDQFITRAEAAAIMERLLHKSGLI